MYRNILIFCLIFFAVNRSSSQASKEKPKLVVGIIVDQMRQEYLYRYYDKFGEGGFKRLLNQGFVVKNAHYNYVPTTTAPGHASIYTGSTPRYHGIISNSWYSRNDKKVVGNVDDGSVKTIGSTSANGEKSPHKLKGTTITDELQISTNGKSKVISISLKDRGSILPGGHMADGAFWFDGQTGSFITSSYYTPKLPEWVVDFNASKKVDSLLKLGWHSLLPIAAYNESNGDDHPYEEGFPGIKRPIFPYDLKKLPRKEKYGLLSRTPHGNTITRQLAEQALKKEALGQTSTTDFLAISFSSSDVVGHRFGPQSIEVQDIYLRLDRDIAHLLSTLDHLVGKDRYTLFLTADHGGSDTPKFLAENKVPIGINSKVYDELTTKLNKNYGLTDVVLSFKNQQIYLDKKVLRRKNLDIKKIEQEIVADLYEMDGVAQVYYGDDLKHLNYTEKIGAMVQLGYNNKLSGDIVVVYEPIFWSSPMDYGTTHGSPYNYDTHVPILWYGGNIPKGETVNRYNITDIAPSIAVMLNIKFPNTCIGRPISELFTQ